MAKRKRLSPAQGLISTSAPITARPPIAQVAGEAAALSALDEMRGEWDAARQAGRLVLSLPLDTVEADHLHRDRLAQDDEAMQSLMDSLRARGQQTPIEVVDLGQGRYGLISGWRRLSALRRLQPETGVGEVQALLRSPKDAPEAYVAMVEENEIRADLSHYERARIVQKALDAGVFETEKAALQGLFAASSYARRSKIKSFLGIVRALDGALRFPQAIPERLGLALVKALEDRPDLAGQIAEALEAAEPDSAEAETAILTRMIAPPKAAKSVSARQDRVEIGAVTVTQGQGRIELSGQGVTPDLMDRLKTWLAEQV